MRLIDADALKERIGKICDESKEGYERSDFVQSNMVMIAEGLKNALFTEIDNEPTAPVLPWRGTGNPLKIHFPLSMIQTQLSYKQREKKFS